MEQPRVYDPDLDGKPENENQQGPNETSKTEGKKKGPKKPVLKLDPTFLNENPRGLKRLYKHVVIDAEKNFQFKGKGHEISDFSKVMKVLKGWHFEAMPKIEISYFAERMQKSGNDKDVKNFLQKLRLVYKGLEVLDDFQPTLEDQQQ